MNWRRESVRVAVVGLTVAVMLAVALAVIPMRTWRAQQARETELSAQLVAAHQEVARLEAHACRAERAGDVALRARQQFNLVPPGAKVYRVILPAQLAETAVDPDENGTCVLGPEPPPTTSTTTTTSLATSSVVTTIVDGVVMMLVPVTTTSISMSTAAATGSQSSSLGSSTSAAATGSATAPVTASVTGSTSPTTTSVSALRATGGLATSLPTFSTRSSSTVSTTTSLSSTVATILVPYSTSTP